MNRVLHSSMVLVLALGFAISAAAQPAIMTNTPVTVAKSPVELFRKLLTMTPEQRTVALVDRSAENRLGILRKIQEYEKMSAEEREVRLNVTELRWYLPPLMRLPKAERAATLASISEPVRKLIEERLVQWDLLPPPLQTDVLEHQSTLGYFVGQNYGAATAIMQVAPPLPPGAQEELTRLRKLSQPQHDEVLTSFQKFYDLSDKEKQAMLDTLSADQRAQMDKAVKLLGNLPRDQRGTYLAAVRKLSSMTDAEQREFLHNAERWSAMTPDERQVWRQIANRVPPLPPLPPGLRTPPMPPGAANAGADQPLITNTPR